ncbi:CRISPR-associated endonuclease, Csn1 family [Rhodopseudomonas palustris BisB5]|uniref:CRISPR-associated endonuclease Cas9 n=1 Tax=Rhodopseudomonas palustris (strain BisB5) TaxID=316057 RepID=Q13CC2_RHOPS|nr:CRISPR-associated endonuclease, Csn1 family [Rhodopseudomonas palustris BisB5]
MSECVTRRILGIDLGIASCGWGVIEVGEASGSIIASGVRCFDAPLIDKTGEPKSATRRTARGQRRIIRRRRQRMNAVRRLLAEFGVLTGRSPDALHQALLRLSQSVAGSQVTPWTLRAAAHERKLTNDELAVVLGHIARHRGFRSNSKNDGGANAADETSKMKKAMETTREGLARYHSFGAMIASDPKFADRKRNRDKDYSHTAKRSDLEDEVRTIFRSQTRFGSLVASEKLSQAFADAAFFQRPLQDSEDMVGSCPFEPGQKRTARRAPSFELFRFLSRLANLKLTVGRAPERRLTPDEIALAAKGFGETKKSITFKSLREALDLDPNARFSGVAKEKESTLDVAARTGGAAYGTKTLKDALGDAPWRSLSRMPEKLDRIAEILSFREDMKAIRNGLEEVGLDGLVVDALMQATANGDFKDFTRAAHISALAARNIIPGLREGLVYSDACTRVGYDHAARPAVPLSQIGSPVTRKALSEALKQVRAVAREYGPIDYFHIELARSIGKSAEERKKLTDGIEARNVEKEKRRKEAAEHLGRAPSDDELLRYELAKEQNFKCIYSGDPIDPAGISANDTRYQVDHILPWSRFGDDSYVNKTLCTARSNQNKRGRTPFEWFDADKTEAEWMEYSARVEDLKEVKGRKKRNYSIKDAASVEDKFKARNLTDTQWATRLLADELKRMFPPRECERVVTVRADGGNDGLSIVEERRVFTRPGAITSKLRRAWGLEGLKKQDGKRVEDDRHHAVDALVLAATTESLLNRLTVEVQQREREGRQDDIFHCSQPWPGFRVDVQRTVYGSETMPGIFVSRAERRRARGKAHDATVKQIRDIDGERIVFERKPIEKLTDKDLERIPVPEPYGKAADPKKLRDELVENLRAWIAAGKPKDKPPRSPKGDIIRKVRIETKDKVAVEINGGTVDRGDMARVDVFRKKNKKGVWEFYVIPIYPHQIVASALPPNRAVIAYKAESEWTAIDGCFEFAWSLNPMSYLELVKSNGELIEGYFRSMDRTTGAINLSPMSTNSETIRSIGVKTLSSFRKFTVDRLGRKFEIPREVRTWRGEACT